MSTMLDTIHSLPAYGRMVDAREPRKPTDADIARCLVSDAGYVKDRFETIARESTTASALAVKLDVSDPLQREAATLLNRFGIFGDACRKLIEEATREAEAELE